MKKKSNVIRVKELGWLVYLVFDDVICMFKLFLLLFYCKNTYFVYLLITIKYLYTYKNIMALKYISPCLFFEDLFKTALTTSFLVKKTFMAAA